jgi:hypothetical protein
MRRPVQILVAILFPLVLLAYPASILLPVEPAEIENVALERPEFSLTRLTSPSYVRELLSYTRSANPMRGALIQAAAGLDYRVFDDTPDPSRVLKGTDGWLYYRPTFETPCGRDIDATVENLVAFVHRISEDVPKVALTIAPSKLIIHPEHLTPEQLRLADCAHRAGLELRRLLNESPLSGYVDSWALFEELKASGTQPYFRTDTHFNFEGSIPWIASLVEELDGASTIWEPSDVRYLGRTKWLGNLMSFVGLNESEDVAHFVIDRELTRSNQELGRRIINYVHTGKVEMIGGTTLILGDSFLELPAPSLVQYFSDVTTMDWRDEEGVDYFLLNAREADVVIIEVSELDVWPRFETRDLLERYESK